MSQPEAWPGHCPICDCDVTFAPSSEDYRNTLVCPSCEGGSVPRERAIAGVLKELRPNWRTLSIHESSPAPRALSLMLMRECPGYVPTQFFLGIELGSHSDGVRCEDLEKQTFSDASFDVVITQDVMEHVFEPKDVYAEIYRTLKPGGLYLHTTPIFPIYAKSKRRAELSDDGTIRHLVPEAFIEYHGNPIDDAGSLVTWHFGADLPDLIAAWTAFAAERRVIQNKRLGVCGPLTDVMVCIRHA